MPSGISRTYFAKLTLTRGHSTVSRNVYWLSTKPDDVNWKATLDDFQGYADFQPGGYADLSGLQHLPRAALTVHARTQVDHGTARTRVTIRNVGRGRVAAVGAGLSGDDLGLGKPWSERKAYVWWDVSRGRWTGHDVPDFEADKPPGYRPPDDATAQDAIGGADPFIMQVDGKAWLFAPTGLTDGPLPTHYEPQESPFDNLLYKQRANPAREAFPRKDNPYHPSGSDVFPYVCTTYWLTEHHTAGGWATIVTARTAIEARVIVTDRVRPLTVHGRTVHQIGLPYHWGPNGVVTGDAANELLPIALDPNVHIQESKAATCDIRPGRRPRGPALLDFVEGYRR